MVVADTHHRVCLWVSLPVQKTLQLEISSFSAVFLGSGWVLFCLETGPLVTRCVDQAGFLGIDMGVHLSADSALSLASGFWLFSPLLF